MWLFRRLRNMCSDRMTHGTKYTHLATSGNIVLRANEYHAPTLSQTAPREPPWRVGLRFVGRSITLHRYKFFGLDVWLLLIANPRMASTQDENQERATIHSTQHDDYTQSEQRLTTGEIPLDPGPQELIGFRLAHVISFLYLFYYMPFV